MAPSKNSFDPLPYIGKPRILFLGLEMEKGVSLAFSAELKLTVLVKDLSGDGFVNLKQLFWSSYMKRHNNSLFINIQQSVNQFIVLIRKKKQELFNIYLL